MVTPEKRTLENAYRHLPQMLENEIVMARVIYNGAKPNPELDAVFGTLIQSAKILTEAINRGSESDVPDIEKMHALYTKAIDEFLKIKKERK